MKEMLSKVELWEQACARYEADHEGTLDIGPQLGARYEAGLTYDILRRQVEFWLESLQSSGPIPMDLSTLHPTDVTKLIEEEFEGALLVVR